MSKYTELRDAVLHAITCANGDAWDAARSVDSDPFIEIESLVGYPKAERRPIQELRKKRAHLWAQLEARGGRGIELADEIDAIDREIESRSRRRKGVKRV
jgi:hypothetical protein